MSEAQKAGMRIERRDRAGWIVLDRPERRNALDRKAIETLIEAISGFGRDAAVHAVVIAAEGTVFSGGADLKELERKDGSEGIRIYASAIEAIMSSARPVIARVQGAAAGGGVGIVAASHLAVAAPSARFLTPETKAGLFPLMVHAILERTIGRKRAFAMDLTGREIDAREALDLGLVNAVVEAGDLDATIESWVGMIAAIRIPTLERALGALHATRGLDVVSRVNDLQRVLSEIAESR